MIRQFELVERIKKYDPLANEDLINKAYVFSMKVHGKQTRASGEPYFTHPIAVAGILADMHLDSQTVATGLLHDTVEDTLTTTEEIEELFGKSVAKLVEGVTKLSELEERTEHANKAENLRKLFVAMADDIRVLLVKLADRLHNMRTLHYVKESKRKRISQETIDIYIPLAERMGMQQVKEELEDLAFSNLHPKSYKKLAERLIDLHHRSGDLINKSINELTSKVENQGINSKVYGREKTPYSIWKKIQKKHLAFEQISDIVAFRVVVNNLEECYRVLGIIHHEYLVVPGKFKDYISTPKPNGYQSIHTTIIGPFNQRIEIQIRTFDMHKVSEDGLAAHWMYKDGHKTKHAHQYTWLKKLLSSLDETANPEDFFEQTKLAMFQDEVFCFTPEGDLITLPNGSTVLDFAFAIHSGIGEHASKAKVNGEITSLRHVLKNGDQISIVTTKNTTVTDAWERFVTTSYAKGKIRNFLKRQKIHQLKSIGKRLLDKHLRKRALKLSEVEKIAEHFGLKDITNLYAAIAEGKLGVADVVNSFENNLTPGNNQETSHLEEKQESDNQLCTLPIKGIDDNLTPTLAKCCHPIPGDKILGLPHSSKAIKIHRDHCKSIQSLSPLKEPIMLTWRPVTSPLDEFETKLRIAFYNNKGNLAEIMSIISQQNASLINIKVEKRNPNFWEVIIDIGIHNLEQLLILMATLKTQSFIEVVKRV